MVGSSVNTHVLGDYCINAGCSGQNIDQSDDKKSKDGKNICLVYERKEICKIIQGVHFKTQPKFQFVILLY
jgi:hypothetical protein